MAVNHKSLMALVLLGSMLLAPEAVLAAFELQIHEYKLSVNADKVPLQDLLRALSYNGIVVRIDPKINPEISADFKDRELEEGLKTLLKPNNHAFIWRTVPPFPAQGNRPYQLEEIHVFKPGEKDQMVVIEASDDADQDNPTPTETQVTIQDKKVFVPVTLAYQDRQIQTTLVLDTGAGGVVLHQNVADQLGIERTTPSKAQGVGGIEIDTGLVQLQYVIVGPHEKKDFGVSIIAYQAPADEQDGLYNGLLGMSFLEGLNYTIDFDAQVIQWQP